MLLPFYMVPIRGLMQKKADHFSSSDVFTERPGKNFAKQCFSCHLLSMLFFPVCSVFFWVICAEQYFWKLLAAGIKHRSFGSLSMGLNPLTFTQKKKKKKAGPSVTSSTCRNGVWLTIEFWWARCTQCREGDLNKMHLWLLSLPRALNQNHRAKTMNIQKLHLHSDWNSVGLTELLN